jgi:hypothetical protein
MRKSDIDTYYDDWKRERLPSIYVKVNDAYRWATFAREAATEHGASAEEAQSFADWCDEHDEDEDLYWLFDAACQSGWENAQCDADNVFDTAVTVRACGRSGGHLVVDGLPDIDSWDAVAVAKWGRFVRYCEAGVKNVPYEMAVLAWLNVGEPMLAEADAEAAEDAAAALPIVSVA